MPGWKLNLTASIELEVGADMYLGAGIRGGGSLDTLFRAFYVLELELKELTNTIP